MLVDLNGKTYKVVWRYDRAENMTLCAIRNVDVLMPSGTGRALRNPKDNWCKETARKLSLDRALRNTSFDKPERRVFWEAYRNRKPLKAAVSLAAATMLTCSFSGQR